MGQFLSHSLTFGSRPVTGIFSYEYKWTRGSSSTTACCWSLSSARQSQSTPSYPSSLISTSILPSNLYFHLPNSLFYSGFTTKHPVCISFWSIQQYKIFILWMSWKQTHWYSVCYWMMLSTAKIIWHHLQMNELAWSIGAIILTEKTEVLGEKFVSVPPCLPQLPHGLAWNRRWVSSQKPVTNCLSYDMTRKSRRKMVQSISDLSTKKIL